jgi:altronate hydrolase
MEFGGEDHRQLARTLAGFARHPNVGAYLLIGLGCETASIPYLVDHEGLVQIGGNGRGTRLPPVLSMQDCGGTTKTIEAGLRKVAELLPAANDVRRESIAASELLLGLNCGGSDGNSGVTANPALGAASDMLVAAGGTTILTETPEVYGAEHLLMRRARSRAVGEKLAERIRWWQHYAGMFGVKMDNNPSVGNKEGGLTTIYEKSLGAVAKAGTTAMNGVFLYGEPISERGFVFMDSPGFDPTSVTGLGSVHHGPGKLLWLQAGALDQDCNQHADVRTNDRRYGRRCRGDSQRHKRGRGRTPNLRADARSGRRP